MAMGQEYNEKVLVPALHHLSWGDGSSLWPPLRALIAVFMNPGRRRTHIS